MSHRPTLLPVARTATVSVKAYAVLLRMLAREPRALPGRNDDQGRSVFFRLFRILSSTWQIGATVKCRSDRIERRQNPIYFLRCIVQVRREPQLSRPVRDKDSPPAQFLINKMVHLRSLV